MHQNTRPCYDDYDRIAEVYDSLFSDEASQKENKLVAEQLEPFKGSFYDIGCGTGLLLELLPDLKPIDYRGVDPSMGMLEVLINKFPEFEDSVGCHYAEFDDVDFHYFDNIVSLFGSISYVDKDFLMSLSSSSCNLFLMFYKPDYYPVTYKKTCVEFNHFNYTKEELNELFSDCDINEFNNFNIVIRNETKRNEV